MCEKCAAIDEILNELRKAVAEFPMTMHENMTGEYVDIPTAADALIIRAAALKMMLTDTPMHMVLGLLAGEAMQVEAENFIQHEFMRWLFSNDE